MNKYLYIISVIIIFQANQTLAQSVSKKSTYQIGVFANLSTSGNTPFWLRSNKYGIIPIESQFISLTASTFRDFDSTSKKRFKLGYGLNTVANIGKINQFLIPEAYIKLKFRAFEISVGRRKEIIGLVDSTLSSGSYIWSGNAMPLPKIQITTPNYVPVLGKGLISVKAIFSQGFFGNQGIVSDYFLHQKTFYARLGKSKWKTKIYAGFNHQVVYGGKKEVITNGIKSYETFPSDIQSFIWAVTGYSLNRVSDEKKDGHGFNDALNRVGNHLGTIDIGAEVNLSKVRILIYRQSIYDDGSLFYLSNIADGLSGISFTFKQKDHSKIRIKKTTFEYFNSMNQGGRLFGGEATIPQLRGNDNYFNNSFAAWIYNKNIIGTPFFSTTELFNKNISQMYIYNNSVSAIFGGISGSINNLDFTFSISNSSNLLSKVKQTSSLLKLSKRVNQNIFNADFGYDYGDFLPDSFGTQVGYYRFF